MAKIEEPRPPRVKRGPPPAVQFYLIAYNAVSALAWGYVLVGTLIHLLNFDNSTSSSAFWRSFPNPFSSSHATTYEAYVPDHLKPLIRRAATTFEVVGTTTTIVQSFAVLEILHALLGWVKSPLGTTLAQVASRLNVVWHVSQVFPATRSNPFYASMVLSWAITEVVRYTFYTFSLLGSVPYPLLYLRYTLFYVLYITGASSENMLILESVFVPCTLESVSWYKNLGLRTPHAILNGGLFVMWWGALYVLYTYMIKQRRKVLGGKSGSQKSKSQ